MFANPLENMDITYVPFPDRTLLEIVSGGVASAMAGVWPAVASNRTVRNAPDGM